MGEGQHTRLGAAPRSLSVIRADLMRADKAGDMRLVRLLERELRHAADMATHLEGGGKRGG